MRATSSLKASRISDLAKYATLTIDGRQVPLNQSPAVEKWKRIVGTTKPLIDVIRRFREKFEVYGEDRGGYVKLVADETTAKDAKKDRLRPIAELAKGELDKMARDADGWARLRDLLARMRTRRKKLDEEQKSEMEKDYTLRKWPFFALFDDIFELRDRERAGGDIRLKTTRRRLTVKRPPAPPRVPRP